MIDSLITVSHVNRSSHTHTRDRISEHDVSCTAYLNTSRFSRHGESGLSFPSPHPLSSPASVSPSPSLSSFASAEQASIVMEIWSCSYLDKNWGVCTFSTNEKLTFFNNRIFLLFYSLLFRKPFPPVFRPIKI